MRPVRSPVRERLTSLLRAASGLIVALALMSCAGGPLQGYPGTSRPDNETALVEVERTTRSPLAANVRITSIDAPRGEVIPMTARRVRLLPGEVCVGAVASVSALIQQAAELCFDASAGAIYEIRVLVAGTPRELEDLERIVQSEPFAITRIWIVDAATLEVVATFTP